VDLSQGREYVLGLIFLKALSDSLDAKRAEYQKKYDGNQERVDRAMSREPFLIPEESRFRKLLEARDAADLGERLNNACASIRDADGQQIVAGVDFANPRLGDANERVRRLSRMITLISTLDLSASSTDESIGGKVYEELLQLIATSDRKTGGEFYTPRSITRLMAQLVAPGSGERIYDPNCGTGGFLLEAAKEAGSENVSLFGQEKNAATWSIARMNLMLHGLDASFIKLGSSLATSPEAEGRRLDFDVVISTPPLNADWDAREAEYARDGFRWGKPPKHRADYMHISHAVASLKRKGGRAAIVVSHGALFRQGSEGIIRRRLVEENLLEGIIALPTNLFLGTAIPAAVMLFRTGRNDASVFFIDASREFALEKNKHRLREEDVKRIISAWKDRKNIAAYAQLATHDEIAANDFNLNLSLYVRTRAPSELPGVAESGQLVKTIEQRLAAVHDELSKALGKLTE
jgi:type I restriction enzyme M protein